jgi:hypothetical protein
MRGVLCVNSQQMRPVLQGSYGGPTSAAVLRRPILQRPAAAAPGRGQAQSQGPGRGRGAGRFTPTLASSASLGSASVTSSGSGAPALLASCQRTLRNYYEQPCR